MPKYVGKDARGTRFYRWTRKEQIANAYEDGSQDEMMPSLKASERRR